MTLNEDRKQTKYGHMRREHMTHTTEDWHYSPLPKGSSRALTVPPGRGDGRSGGPSGQTQTGPQDGDLQSRTDDGGHGGAGSSGDNGGAGSSGGHGRWCLWLWPRSPRPGPYSRNPFCPPPKKFPGEVRGYQEPSGAKHRHRTALRGSTHRTRQCPRNRKPSWASSEAEASSGHDKESGTLTGSLSNRLHFRDKGAGGWKWPPRPLQEEPPAPNESPWTRLTRYIKTVPEGKTRLKNHDLGDMARHFWPWRVDWIHGARVSGGQRAWVSGDPAGLSQRRSGGLESAAGRRALSQRQAGGHWVRGGPVAWSPANGGPEGAATSRN